MKPTAMQDLREDLILTKTSAKEALLEIENQKTRKACEDVLRITLNTIIKRIDDELLEIEKEQIFDAYNKGCSEIHLYYEFIKDENITQTKEPFSAEQYYNETFNK
jgi:hypothetical protein